jgi:tRNA dimethylallyltransferase
VGKTAVAIEIARQRGGEILSIDARQIYRHLELGTAKPTAAERAAAVHHLIDLYEPTERVSAAQFAEQFRAVHDNLRKRGIGALAVGGSGLYVDACLGRLDAMPPADEAIRQRHAALRESQGVGALHARLQEVDRVSAARIAPGDFKRISRALEVHELSGIALSALQRRRGRLDILPLAPMLLLLRDRAQLHERIAQRAGEMLSAGLLDEVARLLEQGIPADCPAFESIGYTEFARVLSGEMTLADARAKFIRRTQRYAKRQLTWFRNRYRGVVEISIAPGEASPQTAKRVLSALAGLPGGADALG